MYNSSSNSGPEGLAFSDRRLQRALAHVNNLWIPVNPEVLRRIRQGLQDGVYDLNIDCLITEIKGDFALFTHCLRKLSAMLKAEGMPKGKSYTPSELFQIAGLDRLKKALDIEDGDISRHSLAEMDQTQAARIGETMISSCTAEALSAYYNIDPDLGYSAAVLRQLGMTLIAWNYPGVYERALTALKDRPKVAIDTILSEILGFSPALLAAALVSEWGLSPELGRAVFDDPDGSKMPPDAQKIADSLAELCRVGEALARANNPEHYPSAASDWASARSVIESTVGFEGIRDIQQRMQRYFEGYTQYFPESIGQFLSVDPETKLQAQREEELYNRNPYINQCPPVIRKKFKDLYATLQTGQASKESVNLLVKQIIPAAGFTGGCIYTLDPGAFTLVPRLKFGTVTMNTLAPVNLETVTSGGDPFTTAFQRGSPMIETGTRAVPDSGAFLTSAIGNTKRIGVLYLEASRLLIESGNSATMTLYKAIRQALCDCLNLS